MSFTLEERERVCAAIERLHRQISESLVPGEDIGDEGRAALASEFVYDALGIVVEPEKAEKGKKMIDEKKLSPIEHLLQYFAYEHLPPHLQEVSKPVGDLAREMAEKLPSNPETTAGLRKLLEAKDCFVRAKL